ncbi:MAG: hypothetical protein N2663_00155 [Chlorobi bacterium]|nr:hypothetical protein [Chlorobiota bacterium]
MNRYSLYAALVAALVLVGCDPHNHDHGNDHAAASRFILHLTNGDTIAAIWNDPDGPGGQSPQIDTIRLRRGSYSGRLIILTTTGDTLSTVIQTQGTEHQLFYTVSGSAASHVSISIRDRDSRGMPLGLQTAWEVEPPQAPVPGSVRIQLYHYEPNKKDGITPSAETDADITFPLIVQP